MVWTLCCKQDLARQIIKWKACLCAGGHKEILGDTYWSTFAPVVSWTTVHLCFHPSFTTLMAYMICGFHNGIYTSKNQDRHLSSVTQRDNNPWSQFNKHLLKLQQNLYGLKDTQVTWHKHIKASLKE